MCAHIYIHVCIFIKMPYWRWLHIGNKHLSVLTQSVGSGAKLFQVHILDWHQLVL